MQFTGAQRGSDEQAFINCYIVQNEWQNDVAPPVAHARPFNLKGLYVTKVLDPAFSTAVPLGQQYSIGLPAVPAMEYAVGIMTSDMYINVSKKFNNTSAAEIVNRWVVVQTYGHCDRIQTNGSVVSTDVYLYTSDTDSGACSGMGRVAQDRRPTLTGQVQVTITDLAQPSATFVIDLTGTNTTGTNATTRWDYLLPGSVFTKPLVYREKFRALSDQFFYPLVTTGADVTTGLPTGTSAFMGFHYAEDDIAYDSVTAYPAGETSPIETKSPFSVTRGFLMCGGVHPLGI